MDLRPTDEQRHLRYPVRACPEAEMAPHTTEWGEAQRFPIELLPEVADLGLMGIQFPERSGGAAMAVGEGFVEAMRVLDAGRLGIARQYLDAGA